MKINWKDFVLMYPIGIIMSIIGGALMLGTGNQSLALLTVGVLMVIPGLFYFYRNSHLWKEAAGISALFGFTFIPAYFVLIIIPLGLISNFLVSEIDWTAFGLIDWGMVVFELVKEGIMFSVTTMIGYLLVKHVNIRGA